MKKDILIIGGGAAGIMAAITAADEANVLLVERDVRLGGILNICIHDGFGLYFFKEELTGPEFADRLLKKLEKQNIEILLETTVIKIKKTEKGFKAVLTNEDGLKEVDTKAIILTSGSYERTAGAIRLPGKRLKGITTAGTAQRYLNQDGYLVGKNIFILGSGDIGLIMARRMSLEGAKVHGVAEINSNPSGLERNIVQCLNDFNIPLFLSHTVTNVEGTNKVKRITISEVDKNFKPISGTEKYFNVDCLLLSVGLIPETNLIKNLNYQINPVTNSASVNQNYETSIPGLFVAGNSLHIHDLVDYVVLEAQKAANCCLNYLKEICQVKNEKQIITQENLSYTIPDKIDFNNILEPIEIYFRTKIKVEKAKIIVKQNNKIIKTFQRRYLKPAEMNKIKLLKNDFISTDYLEIILEELV
ncbi:MAG: NAD(P)/FAD-dependent oxidoreductase [Acholeplasmataceae bacterium]|jgi:thioredoxin reductase|nr:NAD(P)/FAD-dependent oxidoreductase [Acholeplasmataceae bacterium]